MSRFRCEVCDYVYDEDAGAPREGFPPGTAWSDVPDDWPCPDCGVREKVDFVAESGGTPSDVTDRPASDGTASDGTVIGAPGTGAPGTGAPGTGAPGTGTPGTGTPTGTDG